MSRVLNKQDMLEMVYGACLLGGGGGGSLDNGIQLIEEYAKDKEIAVEMLDVEEMEKGKYVGTCGGMGSPLKYKERGAACLTEPITAFHNLQSMSYMANRKVAYLMPLEYGALNSAIPFMVAAECGIQLIDADGTGRAVPSIQTLLYGINQVPMAPFIMTDMDNNMTVSYPDDCLNAAYLDVMGRHVCQASGMCIGVAFGVCSKEEVQNKLVPGAYAYAQLAGKALLNAKAQKSDIMQELENAICSRELFRARLTKFEADSRGGWDFGTAHFEGIGKHAGGIFRIDYQNESLVAWAGDKVLMTVPDLICAVNLDTGDPMSNADFREGMNVLVVAVPAPQNWFQSSRGLSCWQYHFDTIGYKGDIVRY